MAASSAIAANVACVGNSITEGYGIDWGVKKYPDHLQDLMQPGDSVANFGTSGKMFYKESGESYWVQGKIKEALAFPADIVVIELGTNDSKLFFFTYYNVTVDMLKPSYEDLLDTVRVAHNGRKLTVVVLDGELNTGFLHYGFKSDLDICNKIIQIEREHLEGKCS